MDELVLGHHQMVLLVVCALHHDPHKAQRLELNDLLGVGACGRELDPIKASFPLWRSSQAG